MDDIAVSQPQGPYPPYQPPPNLRPAKTKTTTNPIRVILIIAVVAVAVAGGLLALAYYNGFSAPRFHDSNIVNGLITIQPGSYNTYQFTLPVAATSMTVSGTFTASGGSGNDIVVMIMDQTNYINWQNGHQAAAYYNSGQETTGTISASLLNSGTYYLVYSNTFSTISRKSVQTTAALHYYA